MAAKKLVRTAKINNIPAISINALAATATIFFRVSWAAAIASERKSSISAVAIVGI